MERTIVTPELQCELELILNKKLPANIIDDLKNVLAEYQQIHLMESCEPRRGKPGVVLSYEKVEGGYKADFVRKAGTHNAELKKLETAARKMAEVLRHPSYPQDLALSRAESTLTIQIGTRQEIRSWLEDVAAAAREGITKGERGDVTHSYHIKYVVDLGVIYYRATGRLPGRSRPPQGGRPYGPFIDFLMCCLYAADQKERGPESMVKIFEKARPDILSRIDQERIVRKRI